MDNQLQRPTSRIFPIVLLTAAAFGFTDAAYLTVKHFLGQAPTCILFSGCESVTTSAYATIAGIPVALLGAFFYFGMLVLNVAYLDSKRELFLRIVAYGSVGGFVFTLYLMYLQLFVIHALCVYCVASAITSTSIFIVSMVYLRTRSRVSFS